MIVRTLFVVDLEGLRVRTSRDQFPRVEATNTRRGAVPVVPDGVPAVAAESLQTVFSWLICVDSSVKDNTSCIGRYYEPSVESGYRGGC